MKSMKKKLLQFSNTCMCYVSIFMFGSIAGFYKINECFPYIHPRFLLSNKRRSTFKLIYGLNNRLPKHYIAN